MPDCQEDLRDFRDTDWMEVMVRQMDGFDKRHHHQQVWSRLTEQGKVWWLICTGSSLLIEYPVCS